MTSQPIRRVPTNVIVGFLGSGKTTAIANLIKKRPEGERWSVLVNEFGEVSIDHAMVDASRDEIAVQELGGGCACCTLAMVFQPLLAQFIERTKPDRLIIEPSGLSHPANVIDILRCDRFADSIELRNTICLIDPQDFADVRWRETAVFQDQVQMADIVALNWTDIRDPELVRRCRDWIESFTPPKQRILETRFGEIESSLLDVEFATVRFPRFADAHAHAEGHKEQESNSGLESDHSQERLDDKGTTGEPASQKTRSAHPGKPLRFRNDDPDYDACGWIFDVHDVFDRERLLDLLGYVHPIVRLKGVFRCQDDWWLINRRHCGGGLGQPRL